MKKTILMAAAILLCAWVSAQTPVKLGLKAGMNLSTLNLEEEEPRDARLGLNAALLAHIHLTPGLSLQPEIMYSQQGMEDRITGTTNTWKLDYLNVPVQLQYNFNNGFRLQTGPQLGYLLNAQIEAQNGSHLTITDDLKKTDVSWTFGGGYLSYSGFGVDARYNYGLSNINEYEPTNVTTNRVFQLSVFYMLDNQHKTKSK
jgi:hypothetical protein